MPNGTANWVWQTFEVTKTIAGKGNAKDKTVVTTVGMFVPNIEFEQIRPGVNGVRQIRGEVGDVSNRIGQLQREGWIYLDPKRNDYIRAYPARGGNFMRIDLLISEYWQTALLKRLIEMRTTVGVCICWLMVSSDTSNRNFGSHLYVNLSNENQRLIRQQHLPEIKQKIDDLNTQIEAMRTFVTEYQTNGLDVYKQVL